MGEERIESYELRADPNVGGRDPMAISHEKAKPVRPLDISSSSFVLLFA